MSDAVQRREHDVWTPSAIIAYSINEHIDERQEVGRRQTCENDGVRRTNEDGLTSTRKGTGAIATAASELPTPSHCSLVIIRLRIVDV